MLVELNGGFAPSNSAAWEPAAARPNDPSALPPPTAAAYSVAQRTQELGIRQALGARPGDILRLVLGQGFVLALAGVALGTGGAYALNRVMTGLLFHVSATDPTTYVAVGALFAGVALAASYVPARRAARIDPMAALRF